MSVDKSVEVRCAGRDCDARFLKLVLVDEPLPSGWFRMSDGVRYACSDECASSAGCYESCASQGCRRNDKLTLGAGRWWCESHFPVKETIDHPPHYTFGKVEVIDAIEAWGLGFCLGNVVKYVARAKLKGTELEDLKKAKWYLDREIGRLEKP